VQGDVVIGADGFRSIVRAAAFSDDAPRYSGFTVWRGVVPLDGALASRVNPAESWHRGALFGVTRLRGSQAFWYASARTDENEGESATEQRVMLLRRFAYWHDPIPELVEATAAGAIVRTSLYVSPPLAACAAGRIALLGDAARGMLPNLARGACQAIEDAAALADALSAFREVAPALAAYASQQRQRDVKIARRSLQLRRIARGSDPLGIGLGAG
jgi:2-polyprenyl-6-methoxyphenol hydroxylase-like FAD-dependent oxidoreductase